MSGGDDIAAHRVRFIGDPAARIAGDYVRILRFFRFQAWYGEGGPDAAGLHACIIARAGLDTLSRERLRMELLKLADLSKRWSAPNFPLKAAVFSTAVCRMAGT